MRKPLALILSVAAAVSLAASVRASSAITPNLSELTWRNITAGQFNTRVSQLAVPRLIENGRRQTGRIIYGATVGGLVKSIDWGNTWTVVTDALPIAAVSTVAVAPSNPNVVWIGTGDYLLQLGRDVPGNGVYKSTDGGAHWTYRGLPKSLLIGKIVIDPQDANTVYAAVLGSPWQPTPDRGVYRTRDGGATWQRVAFVSPYAGAIDVAVDPRNPKNLLAGFWHRAQRYGAYIPFGPDSALLRSRDGGDTWSRVQGSFPHGSLGKMSIAISPANPKRIYVVVDDHHVMLKTNIDGTHTVMQPGASVFYTSTDGGARWRQTSRTDDYTAEYYSVIVADSADERRLYSIAGGGGLRVSKDAGKTFKETSKELQHPDYSNLQLLMTLFNRHGCILDDHDVWVDPNDPNHVMCSGDSGIALTNDGGENWRHLNGIPGGLYYTAASDYARPFYHIYGTAQDFGALGVLSQTRNNSITPEDWVSTPMTEGTGLSTNPARPSSVYGWALTGGGDALSSVGEYVFGQPFPRDISSSAVIMRTEQEGPHGAGPVVSASRPGTMYIGVNRLYRTEDGGKSWSALTGDMTRHMPSAWSAMGTTARFHFYERDGILSIADSPLTPNVIWVGSSFGMLHVSRDDGRTWHTVSWSTSLAPKVARIEDILPSRVNSGEALIAVNAAGSGDFRPHILKTADFGAHWRRVDGGLPDNAAVWTVAEDRRNPTVIFSGTDRGVFVSADSGETWSPLRNNMPALRVTGIVMQPQTGDLVAATWGRGFYVMSDARALEKLSSADGAGAYLFPVDDAMRFNDPRAIDEPVNAAEQFRSANPPYGVALTYNLAQPSSSGATIDILSPTGATVASLPVPAGAGLHRVVWDLATRRAIGDKKTTSIALPPGRYIARLKAGSQTSAEQAFRINADPQSSLTEAEYRALYAALVRIADAQASASQTYAIAKRLKATQILDVFQPKAIGFDAAEALNAPPGIIQHLDDLRTTLTFNSGPPTKSQLQVLRQLEGTVASLQRRVVTLCGTSSKGQKC